MPGDVEPTLFKPIRIGPNHLNSESAVAPLMRLRASQPGDAPNDFMREYFMQRAPDGGLLISGRRRSRSRRKATPTIRSFPAA